MLKIVGWAVVATASAAVMWVLVDAKRHEACGPECCGFVEDDGEAPSECV